jgi:predicted peptidase
MQHLIQLPQADQSRQPYPLWLVLHGAFATADQARTMFGPAAAQRHAVLLAPQASRPCGDGYCWSFARDAQAINQLLATARATYPIDPVRISLIGYSMGCTMGLWLLAQNPRMFAYFAALGMGSAFARWEHDDGGIDEHGLRQTAAYTRLFLAVDQDDPAGTSAYVEDNVRRLQAAGFALIAFRPKEHTHAVTEAMKAAVLRFLPA